VVGAGQPHGVAAQHALPARKNIHLRVVEHVAHVQAPGDVGRRQQNGVEILAVVVGVEEVFLDPVFGPALFNAGGVVSLWQFVRHKTDASFGGTDDDELRKPLKIQV